MWATTFQSLMLADGLGYSASQAVAGDQCYSLLGPEATEMEFLSLGWGGSSEMFPKN